MSTVIDETSIVSGFLAMRDAWLAENGTNLYAVSSGEVVCGRAQCAGMSMQAAIISGRKGQKTFRNQDFGTTSHLMDAEEVADWKAFCKELDIVDLCECGAVKA